ncbi:MAG: tRNA 2-selenouridine(34) synthase MnmH [Planctomycetota bacterium]
MSQPVSVDTFLQMATDHPLVDVRSPAEFKKAHIVGAMNIPLFDDDQRASVGRTYKHNGRETAVLKGLDLVGPRLKKLAKKLLELVRERPNHSNQILLHCWRGGMRSQSVAWLAEQVGLKAFVLDGGYKAFRKHVLKSFSNPMNLVVLSGLTGSGKTLTLNQLKQMGEQVVDLENLAHHRGSALGGIGLPEQPSVEHFENKLFDNIQKLNLAEKVWLEDESRKIGAATIPNDLLLQMKSAPAIFLKVPRHIRTEIVIDEYGKLPVDEICEAIQRITKRMGGQNTKAACKAMEAGDLSKCVQLLFNYYDKGYMNAKQKLTDRNFVPFETTEPSSKSTCEKLIELANSIAGCSQD